MFRITDGYRMKSQPQELMSRLSLSNSNTCYHPPLASKELFINVFELCCLILVYGKTTPLNLPSPNFVSCCSLLCDAGMKRGKMQGWESERLVSSSSLPTNRPQNSAIWSIFLANPWVVMKNRCPGCGYKINLCYEKKRKERKKKRKPR
jgi:hypothetical protein